jgi:hypothetical protein
VVGSESFESAADDPASMLDTPTDEREVPPSGALASAERPDPLCERP